jgi:hypothetical protein
MFWFLTRLFLSTPEQSAKTTIYCCLDESVLDETGKFYRKCKKKRYARFAAGSTVASLELWKS